MPLVLQRVWIRLGPIAGLVGPCVGVTGCGVGELPELRQPPLHTPTQCWTEAAPAQWCPVLEQHVDAHSAVGPVRGQGHRTWTLPCQVGRPHEEEDASQEGLRVPARPAPRAPMWPGACDNRAVRNAHLVGSEGRHPEQSVFPPRPRDWRKPQSEELSPSCPSPPASQALALGSLPPEAPPSRAPPQRGEWAQAAHPATWPLRRFL